MSYEVDILAVGDESKSGDAIALRFGNFITNPSNQTVIVIDGGFATSGEKLVQRIKNEYGTDYVDLVISTHPDSDHINGLEVLLTELSVGQLWMHTPWNISDSIKLLAEDRDLLKQVSSPNKLKKSLEAAYDLEKLAQEKGITIIEPFEGTSAFNGAVHILGPNLDYYYELVSEFDQAAKAADLSSLFQKVKNVVSELWNEDQLVEPGEDAVSARNNSSVVTLIQLEDNFLFVGDAGVIALNKAADYADSKNFNLSSNVKYHQIPHHGSKRNLGPQILNRLIGSTVPQGQTSSKTSFISAASASDHHPSKRVTNALIRRGATVTATCGIDHYFRSLDLAMRPNWGPVTPLTFCEVFEEE